MIMTTFSLVALSSGFVNAAVSTATADSTSEMVRGRTYGCRLERAPPRWGSCWSSGMITNSLGKVEKTASLLAESENLSGLWVNWTFSFTSSGDRCMVLGEEERGQDADGE